MAIQVTLHLFSGRPNPIWTLTQNDEEYLKQLLESAENLASAPFRGLGYRGFSILETDAADDLALMLFDNEQSDDVLGSFIVGEPELEEFLLWTSEGHVDDELAQHVREAISSPPEATFYIDTDSTSGCPPCGGLNAPSFNPGYWNNDPTRLRRNNCFNYANNRVTNTFAQPGVGSGLRLSFPPTCEDVGAASVRDGLRRVSSYRASLPGWYAALVIWPGRDYHWYRQDASGCWSHKPGETPVRNVDNSGHQISDPKSCDRGWYSIFCSYYVTNSGVTIL